jgi:hypothetical protein
MLTFAQSLVEAVAWCKPRINVENPRWCLRSPELRPDADFIASADPGFFNETGHILQVVRRRSTFVNIQDESPTLSGRFLLADFEITNYNRATEFESNEFFDWADNPPWDLWLGIYQGQLLSWIPTEFVDTVERSLLVECMSMFRWTNMADIGLETSVG